MISVFFLICAILVFCLKTHPGLRVADLDEIAALNELSLLNQNLSEKEVPKAPEPTAKPFFKYRTESIGADQGPTKPHPSFLVKIKYFLNLIYFFQIIETVCNIWFTIEILIR